MGLTAAVVMGVLNVTPDSFSDGGLYLDADAAVAHGRAMAAAGAGIVDVGGESTRPGAEPVSEHEELRRVVPVVEALAPHVRISIDTTKPAVAEAAVAAGASMVNDVSASLGPVAGALGVAYVAMHMQGRPATMQDAPAYGDVVAEVGEHLAARAEEAHAAGSPEVWIDPGIGFGKRIEHNLALLAGLPDLVARGFPVLVGVSRKSFLGTLTRRADGTVPGPDERREASLAAGIWAIEMGASMLRVHDVTATVQALKLHSAPVTA